MNAFDRGMEMSYLKGFNDGKLTQQRLNSKRCSSCPSAIKNNDSVSGCYRYADANTECEYWKPFQPKF